ncbi:MAG: hypothetical protein COV76_03805 [Candidatus Omnitrophica bacterium CG11_big_fil_rev_8_21_14_0_20_64_10]|nr:MAG: hypothetical protein COV76_03805 [Candidatus Omnitrophica bacterium CG11_big_fil_rev_8_21_14_0_20_64_10]
MAALGIALGLALLPVTPGFGQVAPATRFQGAITMLDLDATPPVLKLTDEQGQVQSLTIESPRTTVFQEGRPAKAEALKVGQQVEVEAVSEGDQRLARTIEILPEGASAPGSQER